MKNFDWADEIDHIELRAARAPRRRRRRSLLPKHILAEIEHQADAEYERWLVEMQRAIARVLAARRA